MKTPFLLTIIMTALITLMGCKSPNNSGLSRHVDDGTWIDRDGKGTDELTAYIQGLDPSVQAVLMKALEIAGGALQSSCQSAISDAFSPQTGPFKSNILDTCFDAPQDQHDHFNYVHARWHGETDPKIPVDDRDKKQEEPGFKPLPGDIIIYKLMRGKDWQYFTNLVIHPRNCIRYSSHEIFLDANDKEVEGLKGAKISKFQDHRLCEDGLWFHKTSEYVPLALLRHQAFQVQTKALCGDNDLPIEARLTSGWQLSSGYPFPEKSGILGIGLSLQDNTAPLMYGCYHTAQEASEYLASTTATESNLLGFLPNSSSLKECLASPNRALENWYEAQILAIKTIDRFHSSEIADIKAGLDRMKATLTGTGFAKGDLQGVDFKSLMTNHFLKALCNEGMNGPVASSTHRLAAVVNMLAPGFAKAEPELALRMLNDIKDVVELAKFMSTKTTNPHYVASAAEAFKGVKPSSSLVSELQAIINGEDDDTLPKATGSEIDDLMAEIEAALADCAPESLGFTKILKLQDSPCASEAERRRVQIAAYRTAYMLAALAKQAKDTGQEEMASGFLQMAKDMLAFGKSLTAFTINTAVGMTPLGKGLDFLALFGGVVIEVNDDLDVEVRKVEDGEKLAVALGMIFGNPKVGKFILDHLPKVDVAGAFRAVRDAADSVLDGVRERWESLKGRFNTTDDGLEEMFEKVSKELDCGAGDNCPSSYEVVESAATHKIDLRKIDANRLKNNPLNETKYTDKVKAQMQADKFHGFPNEVDNFAGLGKKTEITGGDGIKRTKIELEGEYLDRKGNFEWIIEPDGSINHRKFEPLR